MIHKILKGLAPVAALAIGTLAAGCDGRMHMNIGDTEGVPLAELDMSGAPPEELVLAGPDRVIVTDGARLDIDVSGDPDAVDALRFSLEEGTLGISREKDSWKDGSKDRGTAVVRVTMPSPRAIVLAGTGSVEAASLAGNADVTIAGSGTAQIARIAAESLDMTIAGSGNFDAAGTAKSLDLTVAGSGSAHMAGLKVESADVTIAGSGDAEFASDGSVDASIMGSGTVTVIGRANCTISAMGSGSLNCRDGSTTAARGKPKAPKPPKAPTAPAAPEPPAVGE